MPGLQCGQRKARSTDKNSRGQYYAELVSNRTTAECQRGRLCVPSYVEHHVFLSTDQGTVRSLA